MSPLAGAAGVALAVVAARPNPAPSGNVQAAVLPTVSPGEAGELSATILETPQPGVPIELRLRAGAVRVVENRLGWSSVVDPQAQRPRLRTRFVAPSDPGTYRIDGVLRYVTCEDGGLCLPHAASVQWTLVVAQPASPVDEG